LGHIFIVIKKISLKNGMLVHIVVSFLSLSRGSLGLDKSYICGDNLRG
jgi:hypothetical protein